MSVQPGSLVKIEFANRPELSLPFGTYFSNVLTFWPLKPPKYLPILAKIGTWASHSSPIRHTEFGDPSYNGCWDVRVGVPKHEKINK